MRNGGECRYLIPQDLDGYNLADHLRIIPHRQLLLVLIIIKKSTSHFHIWNDDLLDNLMENLIGAK